VEDSVCSFEYRVDLRCPDIGLVKFHSPIDVFESPRRQVVNSFKRVTSIEKALGQVAAHESSYTSHNYATLHIKVHPSSEMSPILCGYENCCELTALEVAPNFMSAVHVLFG
jgi:hypothetical protein